MKIYEKFELAKEYFNKQNYNLSLKYLNECIKNKELFKDSLFEIIKVYFELKDYDKVLSYSKKYLKISKNIFLKDNVKVIVAKIYKIRSEIDKALSILDTIKDDKFIKSNMFYEERLNCSYSKFNDFFKVSEFSGNENELIKEFNIIKNLVPQNKIQLFYIARISNYLNNYTFTKKIINKYKDKFKYDDIFYDNTILSEFEIASKKVILDSKPRSMWIATSSKCNVSCIMCHAKEVDFTLSKQDVKDIYSYMPYLEHITWWGGEPTISNLFYEMLNYSLQYKNIKHTIITNGQYMPQKFLDIVSKNNIEIIVSIDSADKEKYETIRKGASFDKLKKNLLNLSKVLDNELIKVNFVVMKKNIKEVKNIINFAKKFNIKKIAFIPLNSESNESITEKDLKSFNANVKNDSNVFDATSIVKQNSNNKQNFKSFCHIPWTDITFSYSGSLIPDNLCSYFGNKHYFLDKYNMAQYWNSKIVQNLRKKIIKEKCCNIYCPKANIKLK